jgi:peroxiredoxin
MSNGSLGGRSATIAILTLGTVLAVAVTGCAQAQRPAPAARAPTTAPAPPPPPIMHTEPSARPLATAPAPTLQARLDQYHQKWLAATPPRIAEVYAQSVATLRVAGVAEKALHTPARAPLFELPNTEGSLVRLADLLQKGPVVVVWFRGGWCPYCTTTLDAYQGIAAQVRAHGATLVAISPQKPEYSALMRDFGGLDFELLADVGNAVARQYGLVYTVPGALLAQYEYNFKLAEYNGDESHELPLAATYVIDRDGIIRYTFVDPNYEHRAEPQDILNALAALGPQ